MNKFMMTACAAALMLPVTAGAAGPEKGKTVKTETTATVQTHKMETTAAATGEVYMTPTSLSTKELLGEGIHGADGARIARIDDIVVNANGKADKVVFMSGGVFGFGGKRGALDYNAVVITTEGDYEPVVSVSLSEQSIKSAVEYKTTAMNDYSLASELIGAKVDLLDDGDDDGESAVINDIILADSGMIEHLIVQESAIGSIGAGTKYAVAYSKLKLEQGDGGLILDLTEDQLEASPVFKTSMRASIGDDMKQSWEKTKAKTREMKDDVEDAVDQ